MVKASNIAAHTLLDQGVRFPIRAPWFIRIFGKKEINLLAVKRLKYGVSISISEKINSLEIDVNKPISITELLQLKVRAGKKYSHIIACAIINNYWFLWLLVRPVAFFVRAYAEEKDIIALLYVVISLSATKDFHSIIDLMSLLVVTNPPESSQPKSGS